MNPLGIHALVWAGGWSRAECEHAVRSTRGAGYDLIEIPALDPAAIDAEHTRAVLADHGVRGVCSLGLDLGARWKARAYCAAPRRRPAPARYGRSLPAPS